MIQYGDNVLEFALLLSLLLVFEDLLLLSMKHTPIYRLELVHKLDVALELLEDDEKCFGKQMLTGRLVNN